MEITADTSKSRIDRIIQILALVGLALITVRMGDYLLRSAPQLLGPALYFLVTILSGFLSSPLWAPLFNPKSFIEYLLWCLIWGMSLPPLLLLVVGWMGAPINAVVIAACYIALALPAVTAYRKETVERLRAVGRLVRRLQIVPREIWWGYFIAGIIFAFLFLICARLFFPHWDHFTFWLLDAKVTFQSGHLIRDLRIQDYFIRSSYYPLHAVIMYFFSGGIVEQYASFITVGYCLASVFLCLLALEKSNLCAKALGVSIIVGSVNVFCQKENALLFTFYGDVVSAFYLTLFVYLLLFFHAKNGLLMTRRISLMTLSLAFLILIKDEHFYYVFILAVAWVGHDLFMFRSALLKAIVEPRGFREVSVVIIFGLFSLLAKLGYNLWVHPLPESPYIVDSVDLIKNFATRDLCVLCVPTLFWGASVFFARGKLTSTVNAMFACFAVVAILFVGKKIFDSSFQQTRFSADYNFVMAKYLYEHNRTMCWLTLSVYALSVYLLRFRQGERFKGVIALFLIPALISLPIVSYAAVQYYLTTQSLRRYVTIVFFLLPLALALLSPGRLKIKRWVALSLNIFSAVSLGYCAFKFCVFMEKNRVLKAFFHHGRYEESWQKMFIDQAAKVKDVVRDRTITVCAMDTVTGKCRMTDQPVIYYRYHLSDVFVGGQLPREEEVSRLLNRTKAEYLFVTNPSPQVHRLLNVGAVDPAAYLFRVRYSEDGTIKLDEVRG